MNNNLDHLFKKALQDNIPLKFLNATLDIAKVNAMKNFVTFFNLNKEICFQSADNTI